MDAAAERLTNFLGCFSIALGTAQLLSPRTVDRMIGIRDDRGAMPMVGLREIACGIGILTQSRPAGWVWGRVAGDIMDLALLAKAFQSPRARHDRLAIATASVVGITALDLFTAQQLSRDSDASYGPGMAMRRAQTDGAIHARKAITILRSPEELYQYWRDLENLPQIMGHLEAVQIIDDRRSHWVARMAGTRVEWDAEITEDRPNELIAWRSIGGSNVVTSGSVRFVPAPGGRGTEVHVELDYRPPGGMLGATILKLLGQAPDQAVQEDLRRFKQLMEAGEVPTTEGQPSGRKSGLLGRRISIARTLEREMR